MKTCTKCKKTKPKSKFYKDRRYESEDRFLAKCKTCLEEYDAAWKKRNPEKYKETLMKSRLRRTYGLTLGGYEGLLCKQGGGCAICGSKNHGGNGGRFHIDHDHNTGANRGLLCSSCNTGIGLFRDDPKILASAIRYLKKSAMNNPSDDRAGKA